MAIESALNLHYTSAMITLLLALTAHAAAPLVLHGDDVPAEEATTRAAAVDGETASQISWASYQASRPASIIGDSTLERCSGTPSTVAKVKEHLQRAQNSLDYMENDAALGHLRAAERATSCSTDRVAAETLARSQFLSGLIMFNEGKKDDARTAWRQALVVQPDLQWDPNFEPSGQPIFEDVRANMQYEAKAQLRVLPAAKDAVALNGQTMDTTTEVMGGTHLLQVTDTETRTMWLKLTAGDSPTVLVPSLFPADLTALVNAPESRQALRETLSLLEKDRTIVVLTPDTAWKSTSGGAWQEVAQKSRRSARAGGGSSKKVIWSIAGGLAAGALGSYASAMSTHSQFKDTSTPNAELTGLQRSTNTAFFTSIGLGTGAAVMVGLGLKP
jgi:hypothetical protein